MIRWHRRGHWQVLAALVAGLGYGVVAVLYGWHSFTQHWVAPFGLLFLNFLKLIAVPLVFSTLVLGVASLADLGKLATLGMRTVGAFLLLSLLASLIAVGLAVVIQPGGNLTPEMRAQLFEPQTSRIGSQTASAADLREKSLLEGAVDLVPENLVAAASSNANLLQLVIVALLLGIGLLQVDPEKSALLLQFTEGVAAVVIQLVKIGMKLAPIGVFGLIANAIVTMAPNDPAQIWLLLQALGGYGLTLLVALALQTVVIYPIILCWASDLPILVFFRSLWPAMLVAFSTSSSAAALPVTIEQCREELRLPDEVTSFVLPLGATLHMNGTAMFLSVAAVFLSQSFSHTLTGSQFLSIIAISVIGSVGAVAIPSIGIVFLVVILETIGVPTSGVALVLGVDRLLDMLRTTTNVTGDAVVATCIASSIGGRLRGAG